MMISKLPDTYSLIEKTALTDIHADGYLLSHNKTHARVMLIDCDDENKVFNIAFRTPPSDSTGVAHILEHSVLCGSEHFPLKDPFVELVKGSLNTFLNAMTYPDKTCYPVASCNDQDFQNLMHVYLDAVFYPNIYKKSEIFRQEGWHYHLEDEAGPMSINGVVYNEMKGAFSSPDDVLEREIMNCLFPDTTYGCESGGDPQCIPDLTYENFLKFHSTYYHPSNSYIYLYGKMDFEEKLNFLDQCYLSHFDFLDVDSEIGMQAPFKEMKELSKPYSISETEDESENTYLSWNKITGSAKNSLESIAFDVLDYVLLTSPGAPLKKALLAAGIGKDVYGSFESGILQPYFSVIAKGAEADQKDEFLSVINNALNDCATKGLDKKTVKAALNNMKFRYVEADFSSYPKGLIYGLDILDDWLYDSEKPFAGVQRLSCFEELEKLSEEGYFEELIRTRFLDNPHGCCLTLVPRKGLTGQREKELAHALDEKLNAMTGGERKQLIKSCQDLEAYQEAPEAPEDLEKLPMLKRSDIGRKAEAFINQELSIDDNLLLFHDVETNGIAYVDVMFDLPGMSRDQVHLLGLLKSLLGMVDTEHYTYGQLSDEIDSATGGILTGVELFQNINDENDFKAKFSIKGKAFYDKIPFLYEMMEEILNHSLFEDTGRIRELVDRGVSRSQSSLISAGHGTAVMRAAAYSSPLSAFQEALSGIDFYQYMKELSDNFEERKDQLVKDLYALKDRILNKAAFAVDYTGIKDQVDNIITASRGLKDTLKDSIFEDTDDPITCIRKNEGFTTAAQVQYVALCGNYKKAGLEFKGTLNILKVLLGYDYLWMNIRVKGGAYGCMNAYKRCGDSYFVSYRDPHLRRTLDVFEGIPDYIRAFDADEREMTKYIIGTISNIDVPKTPSALGNLSKTAYFNGLTDEMLQKTREEILDATVEDIRALAPYAEAILSDHQLCVVGGENAIEKYSDLFMNIEPLL